MTYRHGPAKCQHGKYNFVVVTPPVTWDKAEEVCHLNGYHLAKINDKNIHAALRMLRVAEYDAAWVKSYMGHGCGKDAAVVLRPGKTICTKRGGKKQVRPTTVKIMQKLKAGKCHKKYAVLCQSKKPCPDTNSCLLTEKRPKNCGGKETELCMISKSGEKLCKKACPVESSSTDSYDDSDSTDSTMVEVKVHKGYGKHRQQQKQHPKKQQQRQKTCKKEQQYGKKGLAKKQLASGKSKY